MSPFPIFVRLNPVRVWPNRGHSQLCSLDGTRFSLSFSLSRVRSTPGHSTPLLSSPLPLVVEDFRLRIHKDPSASLHRMRIWDRRRQKMVGAGATDLDVHPQAFDDATCSRSLIDGSPTSSVSLTRVSPLPSFSPSFSPRHRHRMYHRRTLCLSAVSYHFMYSLFQ